MNLTDLSTDQLRSAIQIKEQIESLQAELNSLSGQIVNRKSPIVNGRRRRRTMSPSARARIAAAQRARWAKLKGNSSASGAPRKRRKLSAAGRARIIAATKARWARFHAARK